MDAIRPAGYGAGAPERVVADAASLPLPDGSVDAVVARSVLIYLEDLPAALEEAARVLRPGGLLSVFEPINARRRHDADLSTLTADELRMIGDLFADATPAARTMSRFNETDTVTHARSAGFEGVTVERDTVISTMTSRDAVDGYLNRPPHPGARSPIDTIATFDENLAHRYAQAWQQTIDTQGTITYTTPVMYLTATRRMD